MFHVKHRRADYEKTRRAAREGLREGALERGCARGDGGWTIALARRAVGLSRRSRTQRKAWLSQAEVMDRGQRPKGSQGCSLKVDLGRGAGGVGISPRGCASPVRSTLRVLPSGVLARGKEMRG